VPSIDVIVPCYRYGRFLPDSLGSILSQNVDNLRVAVIDNASGDDSVEVAKAIAKNDPRVTVIAHDKNIGQVGNYNSGLDWVEADYLIISDADDILPAGALERGISIVERDKSVVFCHGTELQIPFEAGKIPPEASEPGEDSWTVVPGIDFIRDVAVNYKFVGATTVIRRTSAQRSAGRYVEGLKYAFDSNMWFRLAALGNVAETKSVQGIRRIHTSQITEQYRRDPSLDCIERYNNMAHFFLQNEGTLPEARELLKETEKAIAVSAFWLGMDLERLGEVDKANACVDVSMALSRRAIMPRILKQAMLGRMPLSSLARYLSSASRERGAEAIRKSREGLTFPILRMR
jgi:hypothetical protein